MVGKRNTDDRKELGRYVLFWAVTDSTRPKGDIQELYPNGSNAEILSSETSLRAVH